MDGPAAGSSLAELIQNLEDNRSTVVSRPARLEAKLFIVPGAVVLVLIRKAFMIMLL